MTIGELIDYCENLKADSKLMIKFADIGYGDNRTAHIDKVELVKTKQGEVKIVLSSTRNLC